MAGRPRKIGLAYFSHDTDLSDDDKIQAIEARYGAHGYTVYLKLLERIYRAGGPIEITPILVAIITRVLREKEDYFREIVTYACEIKLLCRVDGDLIFSHAAADRLGWVQRKRGIDRDLAAASYSRRIIDERRGERIEKNRIEDRDPVANATGRQGASDGVKGRILGRAPAVIPPMPEGIDEDNTPAEKTPKPSRRARARLPVPQDWRPSDSTMAWAAAEGFTPEQVEQMLREFVLYWQGEGKGKADWDATFKNRILFIKSGNAHVTSKSGGRSVTNGVHSKAPVLKERE